MRTTDEGKKLAPLRKRLRLVVPIAAVNLLMEVSVGPGNEVMPTPLKLRTSCGFTGSSLATVKLPVRVPVAWGVKWMVRRQASPGRMGAVQFGRSKLKSAPVIKVCARSICRGAPPLFSINSCWVGAACPTRTGAKLIGFAEKAMTGTTPVPPTGSVVTAKGVLVVNVKFALDVIVATGVNVTRRLQVAFGATGAAHSVVSMVKTGSLETAAVSVNGAVPQFVRVTLFVVDCPSRVGMKPTPKARLPGRQTAGASALGLIFAAYPKLAGGSAELCWRYGRHERMHDRELEIPCSTDDPDIAASIERHCARIEVTASQETRIDE